MREMEMEVIDSILYQLGALSYFDTDNRLLFVTRDEAMLMRFIAALPSATAEDKAIARRVLRELAAANPDSPPEPEVDWETMKDEIEKDSRVVHFDSDLMDE